MSAVQGAHDTIDPFAVLPTPAVRQLGENVAAAGQLLRARSSRLREKRDKWAEGVRGAVRCDALGSAHVALIIGAVLARIDR